MYSNCVMQAPDGQVLCVCDVKKALWYCDKELAGLLPYNPFFNHFQGTVISFLYDYTLFFRSAL